MSGTSLTIAYHTFYYCYFQKDFIFIALHKITFHLPMLRIFLNIFSFQGKKKKKEKLNELKHKITLIPNIICVYISNCGE